eukprot:gene12691-biopygen484
MNDPKIEWMQMTNEGSWSWSWRVTPERQDPRFRLGGWWGSGTPGIPSIPEAPVVPFEYRRRGTRDEAYSLLLPESGGTRAAACAGSEPWTVAPHVRPTHPVPA